MIRNNNNPKSNHNVKLYFGFRVLKITDQSSKYPKFNIDPQQYKKNNKKFFKSQKHIIIVSK